jgi:type I restriction enzyme R subunit
MSGEDIACLVPWAGIETHERRLPHWQQDRVAVFVTWRLADALPQARLTQWHLERTTWLTRHPPPWDDATHRTYAEQFGQEIDRWLDAGHGSCLLREPAAQEEIGRVLQRFNRVRYRLHAWVVMPNHVHVLFSPAGTEPIERTIGAWKGVSARRLNERVGGSGRLWQSESWDTLIRSMAHFAACRRYIADNPARAHLPPTDFTLWLEEKVH